MSARTWTLEQRQQQSQAIKRWKPWSKSTGPKSPEGKAVASRNAFNGGDMANFRASVKEFNDAMRKQRALLP